MKKQKFLVVLGTVAMMANLLLPGLSFAQDDQLADVTIDCPTGLTGPSIVAPADVTFNNVTALPLATSSSFDSTVANASPLPQDHMIVITDERGGAVEGCPLTTPGWTVTAVSTDLTSTDSADAIANPIEATGLRIITAGEQWDSGMLDLNLGSTGTAKYSYSAVNGNLHDIVALFDYNDPAQLFATDATYSSFVTNTLGGAGSTILTKATGQYGNAYTGVGLYLDDNISASQPKGTYQGTITYSVTAA